MKTVLPQTVQLIFYSLCHPPPPSLETIVMRRPTLKPLQPPSMWGPPHWLRPQLFSSPLPPFFLGLSGKPAAWPGTNHPPNHPPINCHCMCPLSTEGNVNLTEKWKLKSYNFFFSFVHTHFNKRAYLVHLLVWSIAKANLKVVFALPFLFIYFYLWKYIPYRGQMLQNVSF